LNVASIPVQAAAGTVTVVVTLTPEALVMSVEAVWVRVLVESRFVCAAPPAKGVDDIVVNPPTDEFPMAAIDDDAKTT
jgi:hypothetical protein